eukprot:jgi/Chrpa1/12852/Chrysochromulina_OHIO_Genome00001032-RA
MTELTQHSPWEEQLEATQLLMDFAVWLVAMWGMAEVAALASLHSYGKFDEVEKLFRVQLKGELEATLAQQARARVDDQG